MTERPEYVEAMQYIRELSKFGTKPGLERMEFMLRSLGDPHKKVPAIHVAGTNGKGSTAVMIAGILKAHGYRVGLYSSPHLIRYNERIIVDGRPVEDSQVVAALDAARRAAEACSLHPELGQPTEFEVSTTAAFKHFAGSDLDFLVLEVGMGGRWDATNVVEPVCSVITHIYYDHTDRLGKTLTSIAFEKAGIIKRGRPVVVAKQEEEALTEILRVASERNAPVFAAGRDFRYSGYDFSEDGCYLDFSSQEPLDIRCPHTRVGLAGSHQALNAAVAIAASSTALELTAGRKLDPELVSAGLSSVKWPCRLELVQGSAGGPGPKVLIDGAHNEDATKRLVDAIENIFDYDRLILVTGILKEKPVSAMLGHLLRVAGSAVFTKPASSRTPPMEPVELAELAAGLLKQGGAGRDAAAGNFDIEAFDQADRALERALEMASEGDMVCVCGSLYLAGELRRRWPVPTSYF